MKWLPRHLLRFICLLPVLYFVILYSMNQPNISPEAFYLNESTSQVWAVLGHSHFLIAAGIFLLLAFMRGMTLVWNAIYCCTTVLLLLEIIILAGIGDIIFPSALWSIPYSIPFAEYQTILYFIPLVWLLGAICTNAFRSITAACCINFVIWLLLAYACHALAQLWETMDSPFRPDLLEQFKTMRWSTAVLPALFMFLYTFFLSLFEALIPRQLIDKDAALNRTEIQSKP